MNPNIEEEIEEIEEIKEIKEIKEIDPPEIIHEGAVLELPKFSKNLLEKEEEN